MYLAETAELTKMSVPDEENQLFQAPTQSQTSSTGVSTEKAAIEPRAQGYYALAQLMNKMPRVGIYRRFGILNGLSILFYQAELMKLEKQLFQQISRTGMDTDSVGEALGKDWHDVPTTGPEKELMDKIRNILEKYSK